MVTPIDAVRSGMGFDAAGHWHQAKPRFRPAQYTGTDEDPLAPARGATFGLLMSAALWIGLVALGKALLNLF